MSELRLLLDSNNCCYKSVTLNLNKIIPAIFLFLLVGDSNIHKYYTQESLSIPLLFLHYSWPPILTYSNHLFCIVILCKYYKHQPILVYNLLDWLYITVLTLFPGHTRTIDELYSEFVSPTKGVSQTEIWSWYICRRLNNVYPTFTIDHSHHHSYFTI